MLRLECIVVYLCRYAIMRLFSGVSTKSFFGISACVWTCLILCNWISKLYKLLYLSLVKSDFPLWGPDRSNTTKRRIPAAKYSAGSKIRPATKLTWKLIERLHVISRKAWTWLLMPPLPFPSKKALLLHISPLVWYFEAYLRGKCQEDKKVKARILCA